MEKVEDLNVINVRKRVPSKEVEVSVVVSKVIEERETQYKYKKKELI